MAILDTLALGLISGLVMYNIKKIDALDSRIDVLSDRFARLESLLPKRKEDRSYYSENSGIDL